MNASSRTMKSSSALVVALGLTLGALAGCGKQPQPRESTEAAPGSCTYTLVVRFCDGRLLRISKYTRLDVAIEAMKVEQLLGRTAEMVAL